MELNGVSSNAYVATGLSVASSNTKKEDSVAEVKEESVVYQKSDKAEKKATYGNTRISPEERQATIDQLKADAEARYSQLQDLVNKLMNQQNDTYQLSLSDLFQKVKDGEIKVDPEIVEQAKKDVADDGYWGVEQTATRIVDFAKALTGSDPSQIEKMRKAIDKGFGLAKKDWGSDLPEISSKTYDRVNELLDEWAKSANE